MALFASRGCVEHAYRRGALPLTTASDDSPTIAMATEWDKMLSSSHGLTSYTAPDGSL